MRLGRRFALVAAGVCLALPGMAFAKTVYPGRVATFSAWHLDAKTAVSVTLQPWSCRRSNNCGRLIKGTWHTDANGAVRLSFRFPRSYYSGCTRAPCSRHPGPLRQFKLGSTALVYICTINAKTYIPKCVTRVVGVGRALPD